MVSLSRFFIFFTILVSTLPSSNQQFDFKPKFQSRPRARFQNSGGRFQQTTKRPEVIASSTSTPTTPLTTLVTSSTSISTTLVTSPTSVLTTLVTSSTTLSTTPLTSTTPQSPVTRTISLVSTNSVSTPSASIAKGISKFSSLFAGSSKSEDPSASTTTPVTSTSSVTNSESTPSAKIAKAFSKFSSLFAGRSKSKDSSFLMDEMESAKLPISDELNTADGTVFGKVTTLSTTTRRLIKSSTISEDLATTRSRPGFGRFPKLSSSTDAAVPSSPVPFSAKTLTLSSTESSEGRVASLFRRKTSIPPSRASPTITNTTSKTVGKVASLFGRRTTNSPTREFPTTTHSNPPSESRRERVSSIFRQKTAISATTKHTAPIAVNSKKPVAGLFRRKTTISSPTATHTTPRIESSQGGVESIFGGKTAVSTKAPFTSTPSVLSSGVLSNLFGRVTRIGSSAPIEPQTVVGGDVSLPTRSFTALKSTGSASSVSGSIAKARAKLSNLFGSLGRVETVVEPSEEMMDDVVDFMESMLIDSEEGSNSRIGEASNLSSKGQSVGGEVKSVRNRINLLGTRKHSQSSSEEKFDLEVHSADNLSTIDAVSGDEVNDGTNKAVRFLKKLSLSRRKQEKTLLDVADLNNNIKPVGESSLKIMDIVLESMEKLLVPRTSNTIPGLSAGSQASLSTPVTESRNLLGSHRKASSPVPQLFSTLNRNTLKDRLRPLVAAALSSPLSSSTSLEDKVAMLKKMLSEQLPPHVREQVFAGNFEQHARKLFLLQQSSVTTGRTIKTFSSATLTTSSSSTPTVPATSTVSGPLHAVEPVTKGRSIFGKVRVTAVDGAVSSPSVTSPPAFTVSTATPTVLATSILSDPLHAVEPVTKGRSIFGKARVTAVDGAVSSPSVTSPPASTVGTATASSDGRVASLFGRLSVPVPSTTTVIAETSPTESPAIPSTGSGKGGVGGFFGRIGVSVSTTPATASDESTGTASPTSTVVAPTTTEILTAHKSISTLLETTVKQPTGDDILTKVYVEVGEGDDGVKDEVSGKVAPMLQRLRLPGNRRVKKINFNVKENEMKKTVELSDVTQICNSNQLRKKEMPKSQTVLQKAVRLLDIQLPVTSTTPPILSVGSRRVETLPVRDDKARQPPHQSTTTANLAKAHSKSSLKTTQPLLRKIKILETETLTNAVLVEEPATENIRRVVQKLPAGETDNLVPRIITGVPGRKLVTLLKQTSPVPTSPEPTSPIARKVSANVKPVPVEAESKRVVLLKSLASLMKSIPVELISQAFAPASPTTTRTLAEKSPTVSDGVAPLPAQSQQRRIVLLKSLASLVKSDPIKQASQLGPPTDKVTTIAGKSSSAITAIVKPAPAESQQRRIVLLKTLASLVQSDPVKLTEQASAAEPISTSGPTIVDKSRTVSTSPEQSQQRRIVLLKSLASLMKSDPVKLSPTSDPLTVTTDSRPEQSLQRRIVLFKSLAVLAKSDPPAINRLRPSTAAPATLVSPVKTALESVTSVPDSSITLKVSPETSFSPQVENKKSHKSLSRKVVLLQELSDLQSGDDAQSDRISAQAISQEGKAEVKEDKFFLLNEILTKMEDLSKERITINANHDLKPVLPFLTPSQEGLSQKPNLRSSNLLNSKSPKFQFQPAVPEVVTLTGRTQAPVVAPAEVQADTVEEAVLAAARHAKLLMAQTSAADQLINTKQSSASRILQPVLAAPQVDEFSASLKSEEAVRTSNTVTTVPVAAISPPSVPRRAQPGTNIISTVQKPSPPRLVVNEVKRIGTSSGAGKLNSGITFFSRTPFREFATFQSDRDGGVSLVTREGRTLVSSRAGARIPVMNHLPAGLAPTLRITPVFISGVGGAGQGRRKFF